MNVPHPVRQRVQSFLRKNGFTYAEWTCELSCYGPEDDYPHKASDLDFHSGRYKEWSDLEYYLYNELGEKDLVAFELKK